MEAVRLRREVLGDSHPDTLRLQNTLASLYQMVGRLDEAEALYAQTLEGKRKVLGEDPSTLGTMFNPGMVYCKLGRFEKGESFLKETLALHERSSVENTPRRWRFRSVSRPCTRTWNATKMRMRSQRPR